MHDFFSAMVDIVELVAVLLLMAGLVISTGRYLLGVFQKDSEKAYFTYRRDLGRTLLLTLEFLIAADILETVAVEKTLTSLALLGGLVLVRTFLSFALELELHGKWPWQGSEKRETSE